MGVGNGPSHVAEQGQVRGQQYRTMLPAFCAQLVIAPPPHWLAYQVAVPYAPSSGNATPLI